MDVSKSIRQLRERHDLTQEQFGTIAGVSAMAVSQWENGRAVPRMGAIQKLSDFFGVPKSTIMGDAVNYAVVEIPQPLSDNEQQLVDLYRQLSPEYREMLLKTAVAYRDMTEKDSAGMREVAGLVMRGE